MEDKKKTWLRIFDIVGIFILGFLIGTGAGASINVARSHFLNVTLEGDYSEAEIEDLEGEFSEEYLKALKYVCTKDGEYCVVIMEFNNEEFYDVLANMIVTEVE